MSVVYLSPERDAAMTPAEREAWALAADAAKTWSKALQQLCELRASFADAHEKAIAICAALERVSGETMATAVAMTDAREARLS